VTEQVLDVGEGFFFKEKIVIVDVSGVITGSEGDSFITYRPNVVSEVRAQLDRAGGDAEVKAVVLRISSPGGEVTACDTLYHEVRRFREEYRVPVVAYIHETGASGGYYVACAADTIIAHPTAVVGSIGVIFQRFDVSGLMQKIGVQVAPVKSSEEKDLGSIFRPPTAREREIFQKLVDDMYQRFVDVVDAARKDLDRDAVLQLADGRVVSGGEAARGKLVDRVAYFDEAITEAAKLANVDSPTVVRYTRRPQGGSNIYTGPGGLTAGAAPPVNELTLRWSGADLPQARLYYLWHP
jgi:protease-4